MTAAALATACGGSTDADGGSNGGSSGTGSGGTAGASGSGGTAGTSGSGGGGTGGGTGGTGGFGGTAGSGGAGGSAGGWTCPAELPNWWETCTLPAGATCSYDVPCQSGIVPITYECAPENGFGGWTVVPTACSKPYDSCPGTELYCSSTWSIPQGTNPPAPCPSPRPEQGASCWAGGFGGNWEHCGYPCDSGGGWTVASCVTISDGGSIWQYDGACPP